MVNFFLSTDQAIENFFEASRSFLLTKIFIFATILGNKEIIIALAIFLVGIFWIYKKQHYILPLIIATLGAQASVSLLKIIFQRSRPLHPVYLNDSFSFPSGHATLAVAFYGFVIYLFRKEIKNQKTKTFLIIISLAIILIIGISRLYLDMHFFTDILGGYFLGFMWIILGIMAGKTILKNINERGKQN